LDSDPISDHIAFGYALPPATDYGLPRIAGLPPGIVDTPPEIPVAGVRLSLPTDVLAMIERTIRRCRYALGGPPRDTWCYLEVILVHFIQSQDTPQARAIIARHRAIARDGFWCRCAGCTSRSQLQEHHLEYKSRGGSDDPSNISTFCAGHHLSGEHAGRIEVGGWAPYEIYMKVGINPRTGKALAYYKNDRRVSPEVVEAGLARWRRSLREGGGARSQPSP
jgi:hypothetical protein